MDVNYKNQKRYKTAKYPIRQPLFFVYLIWLLSKIVLIGKKYKVEKINMSSNGDDAVLILKISEMNSELASLRTSSITLIKDEYEGIKVKNTALRVVDGKTGVFVVSGMEAKFVTIDIIHSTEEYTVGALNTTDSSKLRLYDKIIVKGKNLYDGKIIY